MNSMIGIISFTVMLRWWMSVTKMHEPEHRLQLMSPTASTGRCGRWKHYAASVSITASRKVALRVALAMYGLKAQNSGGASSRS